MRTDYKPLIRILTDKPIEQLTARLQRFWMKLMKFTYKVKYLPGKNVYAPDAFSRHPLDIEKNDKDIFEADLNHIGCVVRDATSITNYSEDEISEAQNTDQTLATIKSYVLKEWPTKQVCAIECAQYYKYGDDIAISSKILTYKDRLIVPDKWKKRCIKNLHARHFGLIRCKKLAK